MKQKLNVFDRAREIVGKEYSRITIKSNGRRYEAKKDFDGEIIFILKNIKKMTQQTVENLIKFRDELRKTYAVRPGRKGRPVEIGVYGDGSYYVDNGFGAESRFVQPAVAIDVFNSLVEYEYELK